MIYRIVAALLLILVLGALYVFDSSTPATQPQIQQSSPPSMDDKAMKSLRINP